MLGTSTSPMTLPLGGADFASFAAAAATAATAAARTATALALASAVAAAIAASAAARVVAAPDMAARARGCPELTYQDSEKSPKPGVTDTWAGVDGVRAARASTGSASRES